MLDTLYSRRTIPDADTLYLDYYGAKYDADTYRDGVFCECGAVIVFKERAHKEPVKILCKRCGRIIRYS